MAQLSWGKPKIEVATVAADGTVGEYEEWDTPVEDSTTLTVEQGEKIDATEEGGAIVDSRRKANSYNLELTLFVKTGGEKPIEDADGVIAGSYAVRLTPEDPANEGFVMEKTTVSITESFTAADGKRWTYTFDGVKPKTGNILKPYLETTTP